MTAPKKRGHPPKGKRHGTDARWPALLAAARLLLAERVVSIRALARACRVDDRTLRRWLDGTDIPGDERIYHIDSVVERLIVQHWPDEALPSPVIEHARYDYRGRTDRRRAGSGRYTES